MFCWKHYFYKFSAKHSFAEVEECNLKKKQELTKNRGGVCQHAKRCFCYLFLLLFGGFGFSLFFIFLEKSQKGYFPSILEFFFLSPKGLSLKSFFSILFSFLVFLLSSLSKLHFFLCLFVHQPLFGKHSYFWFLYLSFSCLFLSECLLVSFKKSFLKSHFWNPSCFHFGCLSISSVVFVFMFHVSAFLFWCWLCFWYVLFCSCLVFVLFLVLLSQTMKNIVIPATRSFLVMLVTR